MKTIVVPTDFSAQADNAARYAAHIAAAIHADIHLVHAFLVPVETAEADQVVWPLYHYETILKESNTHLLTIATSLRELNMSVAEGAFTPSITFSAETGPTVDIIKHIAHDKHAQMVLMGLSGAGTIERFFMGSTSREMINEGDVPLLLVPAGYYYSPLHHIAFATDLNSHDIQPLKALTTLARYFKSRITLFHITDGKEDWVAEKCADLFIDKITAGIEGIEIGYRHVKSIDINHGLQWIAERRHVGLLAMVHRKHSWLGKLLGHSYSQWLAKHANIPLLIYPANED